MEIIPLFKESTRVFFSLVSSDTKILSLTTQIDTIFKANWRVIIDAKTNISSRLHTITYKLIQKISIFFNCQMKFRNFIKKNSKLYNKLKIFWSVHNKHWRKSCWLGLTPNFLCLVFFSHEWILYSRWPSSETKFQIFIFKSFFFFANLVSL